MLNTFAFTLLDTVQTGQKQVINHFVKHDKLSSTLNQFVDNQTQYTKDLVKNLIDFNSELLGVMTAPKFVQEITENYGLNEFIPTAKAASKKSK